MFARLDYFHTFSARLSYYSLYYLTIYTHERRQVTPTASEAVARMKISITRMAMEEEAEAAQAAHNEEEEDRYCLLIFRYCLIVDCYWTDRRLNLDSISLHLKEYPRGPWNIREPLDAL